VPVLQGAAAMLALQAIARIASAVLAMTVLFVCLSICPSHAGIVSKRLHAAQHGAVCTVR